VVLLEPDGGESAEFIGVPTLHGPQFLLVRVAEGE
jgi:hypothetical protein